MDTSEQYIKMCEKAEEIQEHSTHIPPLDILYHKTEENLVYLPRQDQLQEMIDEPLWQLNFRFIDWLCDIPFDGHIRHLHLCFKSMEQLWLSFVMKEKFGKMWDGERWK